MKKIFNLNRALAAKKKIYSIILTAVLLCCGTSLWGDDLTLTVMDESSSNQKVPVDGYNLDGAQHSQLLFLSSELSAMNGGTIKGLKFYFNKTGHSWNNSSIPTVVVRLKEVENSSLTSLVSTDGSTQVYSGTINLDFTNKLFTITFDDAYSYGGGNLLIDFQTTPNSSNYVRNGTGSSYMRYYGSEVSGRAMSSSTAQGVCPKTTFTYEEAAVVGGCNKPKNLAINTELPDGATFTWEQNVDETVYQWACVASGDAVEAWNTLAENVRTKTVEGLTAGTAYDFYVRSYCGEGEDKQSDAVKKTFTPSCPAPTYPATPVTAKAATTATITWNAADGISKYQYICVEKNAAQDWSKLKEVATTSADLAGLTAYTEYDFYVRSWYSATSISDAVKTTFRTECAAVNAPYAWNFEDATAGATPGCWDNSASTAVPGFGSDDYNWTAYSYSSNKSLRMYNSYLKKDGISLINTPSIVLPASPVQELAFTYSHRASCGDFMVKISTDGGANFTDLKSYSRTAANSTYDPGTFEEATISLADYAGETIILQFFATADYDGGAIFVDDLDIHAASSCAKPSAVSATATSHSTATVSWTNGGEETAWNIRYSTDGENWTTVVADANPFGLTGLSASTTYQVQVQANCGGDQSLWVASAEPLETPCAPAAIGWSEDFNGASALPECWKTDAYGNGNGQWYMYSNDARFNARVNTSTYVDLQTPPITLSDIAELVFTHSGTSVAVGLYINAGEGDVLLMNIPKKNQKDTCDLSAYKGKTVYFIFRAQGYGNSSVYFYLEDLKVSYKPVAAPTNLTATPANASAVVTWERAEADAKDSLRYRVNGSEDEWTKVANIEGKTYTIESLTNSTTYEVQVKTVASANRQSDWTASQTFTPVDCPSVETVTFGAKTYNSVVVNWTTTGAGTWNIRYKTAKEQDWTVVEGNIAENTKKLEGLTPGEVYTIAVKPSCNDGEEAWVAAAETYTPLYTAPSNVVVTNISDVTATASWDAVADAPDGYLYVVSAKDAEPAWNNATQTEELTATLSNLEAATEYDLHVVTKYGQYYSSDSKFSFTTSTVAPKNLTAGEITTTTATFSWENDGAATKYQWSTDNTNWSAAQEGQTATVTGLNANTSYTFYVRSYYDENIQSAAVSLSFRTECAAITVLPWSLNFDELEAGQIPECWDNSGSTSATYATTPSYFWTAYKYSYDSDAKMLKMNNTLIETGTAVINTPRIELPASPAYEFDFDYSHKADCGALIVKVSEDGGDHWTELGSYTNETGGTAGVPADLIEASIDLTSYAGKTIILQFYAMANYRNGAIFVDNVAVRVKSNCPLPKNVTVSSITDHTAKVAWTEKGEVTAWKLQTSTDGSNWGEEIEATTNPFTLTGLTAETTYYVRVKSACEESYTDWSDASAAFTTQCAAKTLPFATEGFDAIPECWSVDPEWELSEGSIKVKSYTASLTMPLIVLSEKAQLSFKHSASYNNSVKYYVYVNDGESEEKAEEMYSSTSWKQATVDLSAYIGKTVNIIFRSSTSSYTLYLDDVAVNYLPVAAPTDVVVTPANESAVVTWESTEGTTYALQYRVNGSEDAWTEVKDLTEKTYTINGLTNGTAYEVQVKAIVSENRQSDWTASAVVTPMACPTITGIELSEKTYNSVKVSWTASGTGTWVLEYGLNAPYTVVENLAVTEYVLDNLTPGETYTIKVHPNCSEESLQTTYYPAYTAPTNVVVTNINDVTATASWDAVADATLGYTYSIAPRGNQTPWAYSKVVTNKTSVELNGLAGGSDYDFYVVTNYPDDYMSPAVKIEFSTIAIAPKNLTAGEITTTAATFTWEANGAAVKYQWSTDNTNWSDAQTERTATATGLNAGTSYTFYVRSYYAEGKYSAAINLPFNTECDIEQIGYTQDFEAGGKPLCWEVAEENWAETFSQKDTGNKWSNRYGSTTHQGNYALYYNSKTDIANSADITMPRIAIDKAAKLLFYIKNNNNVTGEVRIAADEVETQVVALRTTGSNFNTLQEIDLNEAFIGKTVTITFHAQGAGTSENSSSLAIDDIEIAQVCQKPTNLAATATSDGAEVTWEGEEDQYQYCVVNTGNDPAGWVLLENDVKSVTITGKQVGKSYDVYVRAYCGAANQSAAVMTTFVPAETPSALGNVSSDTKTVKLIENDQIVIIRDGVKYNAQGQKLQ